MTAKTLTVESKGSAAPALNELVGRVHSLYTLPAVAAQVIQLTNNPKIDTRALKECIQTDPALAAKILRVVNSSLFGLSREVGDLNQAIALLGTKPLKLLVLGFSLPEKLFHEVAREQLDWFWTTTLTRAVTARAISEKLYDSPGDDAFLAGLLQDIGVLVLLGQLQKPYAKFLSSVIHERVDLRRVEVASLGFDHQALTAALLRHWKMPELLVKTIAEPRNCAILAKQNLPHSELARTLHMAELLAELVGQNRLAVLPELLEAGERYGKFNRESLGDLAAYLQPQVNQLAEVMSLHLQDDLDFVAVITEAHQQMSLLAESVAEPLSPGRACDEQAYANVLAGASHLRSAVDTFLEQPASASKSTPPAPDSALQDPQHLRDRAAPLGQENAELNGTRENGFERTLTLTVGQCRAQRQPVSLVLLGAVGEIVKDAAHHQVIGQLLDAACQVNAVQHQVIESLGPCQRVVILPGIDRQQAVRFGQQVVERIQGMVGPLDIVCAAPNFIVGVGVASVALPPRNFPPLDLLETANRCLSAAQSGEAFGVKSLEIF